MKVRVGTSGYSYKEWCGTFYPSKTKPAEMLAHYGRHLDTVEINNTFYRMPRENVLQGWAQQVPEGFSFVIKASRRITHSGRLGDVADSLDYLVRKISVLESRLGPVLFQLPPFFRKDAAVLRSFLALLPGGIRAAFEFRNASWFDDEVYDLLRDSDAALVVADSAKRDETPIVPTASFGYLRLRREDYDDTMLERWAERVAGQGWQEVFAFFKHEEAGAAPRLAARFRTHLPGGV